MRAVAYGLTMEEATEESEAGRKLLGKNKWSPKRPKLFRYKPYYVKNEDNTVVAAVTIYQINLNYQTFIIVDSTIVGSEIGNVIQNNDADVTVGAGGSGRKLLGKWDRLKFKINNRVDVDLELKQINKNGQDFYVYGGYGIYKSDIGNVIQNNKLDLKITAGGD